MTYSITFYDFWHLASGTSAGVSLDSLVVKDRYGLPYVPGKTLKGLVREHMELLDRDGADRILGTEGNGEAKSYFSNATLDSATVSYLKENEMLARHLFDKVTSTRIDSSGIADDKTLREIEVVVPLTLYGTIECHADDEKLIAESLMMVKQMGLNRNRGLGRCKVEVSA